MCNPQHKFDQLAEAAQRDMDCGHFPGPVSVFQMQHTYRLEYRAEELCGTAGALKRNGTWEKESTKAAGRDMIGAESATIFETRLGASLSE